MFEFVEDGRYLVRDLIQVPIEEMKRSPEAARIFLTFDDGEIEHWLKHFEKNVAPLVTKYQLPTT